MTFRGHIKDSRLRVHRQSSWFGLYKLEPVGLHITTSTPQLPIKRRQIPSNRDHKALNGGTFRASGPTIWVPGRLGVMRRVLSWFKVAVEFVTSNYSGYVDL